MEEKSTSKLMEILKHTKKTELAALQDDLTVQSHSFITYMDRLIEQAAGYFSKSGYAPEVWI